MCHNLLPEIFKILHFKLMRHSFQFKHLYLLGPDECKLTTKGKEYMGQASTSEGGSMCVEWSELELPVYYNTSEDRDVYFPSNFCRNTMGFYGNYIEHPFCYVEGAGAFLRREYCDIEDCG